jgi:plasmid stability protein
MRTTLTLDEDVAARLRAEARRSGRPFRAVVNEMLRQGLTARGSGVKRKPFKAAVRDLGELKPGLSLDDIAGLLEQVEGPLHR